MQRLRFFYKYSFVAAILWVVLVAIGANLQLSREENRVDEIIKSEAASTLDKDKALAFWLMQHNDKSNSKGALSDFTEVIGVQTKIIGYKEFDKLAKTDAWLSKILPQMKANKKEYYEIMETNEQHYSRLAAPMKASAKCVQCHTNVHAGDVIGIMTIAIPMKNYTQMRDNVIRLVLISHTTALFLGLVFIYIVFRLTRRYVHSIERQQLREIQDYEDTLNLLVALTEERDAYTAGHAERVAKYCTLIGRYMGLSEKKLEILEEASRLHDIGKVAVPDTVLLKPGALTDSEYLSAQSHVTEGYKIISKMQKYAHLAEIIRYHHEKYDGTGYPYGKLGSEIPIESSIMAVADSFDAMTSNRIYKPRKSISEAIDEIKRCRGAQFHPLVADAAIDALKDVEIPHHISQLEDNIRNEHKLAFFFKDALTGLYNLEYLKMATQRNVDELSDYEKTTIISLKNFSRYNNAYGWEAGNELLKGIANFINSNFKDSVAFRVYGDIFIILCKDSVEICVSDIGECVPSEAREILRVSVSCKKGCSITECDYISIKKLESETI